MKFYTVIVMLLIVLALTLTPLFAEDYLIQPGDNLGITVMGESDLTRKVTVGPQGGITLPLVNEIAIAGMTTTQAAQKIAEQLKQFLKNPTVSVELLEAAKLYVTISGEIKSPGIYPLTSGARLMDVVTQAGGYTSNADLSKVTINHIGGTESATVDLSKFLLSGDSSTNVALSTGDTIIIPARGSAAIGTIMILGAARQTGAHSITQGMTIREAIMLAGGPTEYADLNNITLRREGSTDAVPVDYAKAVSGDKSADPELKPGDVIFIAAREQLGYYTIQGAIGAPGRYELKGKTPITEAIAIAGGVRGRAKLGDVRILRSTDGATKTIQANVSAIMVGNAENIPIQDGDNIFISEGGQKPDFMRILSLALSLGWLLTRR